MLENDSPVTASLENPDWTQLVATGLIWFHRQWRSASSHGGYDCVVFSLAPGEWCVKINGPGLTENPIPETFECRWAAIEAAEARVKRQIAAMAIINGE